MGANKLDFLREHKAREVKKGMYKIKFVLKACENFLKITLN